MTLELNGESKILTVEHLSTHVRQRKSTVHAVDDVSFSVASGETVGIVGESGCGKTMAALSVIGLLPPGGAVMGGSIRLDGVELVGMGKEELRQRRGSAVGMIFQDPMTSLNPSKTIGWQIGEPLRIHRKASKKEQLERALELLSLVGIPAPAERVNDFPHQLSGGMRQRVMIAIALALEPKLLIADEPTTALDVTIQAQILELLDRLKEKLGMGLLLVTHDLGVIAGHADRVVVMYAGRVVEEGTAGEIFAGMSHPYTQALLSSIPRIGQDRGRILPSIPGLPPDLSQPPAGCRFASRCRYVEPACRASEPELRSFSLTHRSACHFPVDGPLEEASVEVRLHDSSGTRERSEHPVLVSVRDLTKEFPLHSGLLQRRVGTVHAVVGVSFDVYAGETFGVVGESGCGKTTLGRILVGLETQTSGSLLFNGADMAALGKRELRRRRRDFQLMFQDPYASLDPRMRIGTSLQEPLVVQGEGGSRERADRVGGLLLEVGLRAQAVERYPHEFSGGQRQRVGFARALVLNPRLIVADEPVSALDVSIRSQIINMMRRLQNVHDLTYVLISHDMAVVSYLADRVGVMYLGRMVEIGDSLEVFEHPAHPYTQGLLRSVPVPDPARARRAGREPAVRGELPSPINPPSGCHFRTRCPFAIDVCSVEVPGSVDVSPGHSVSCHRSDAVYSGELVDSGDGART